MESERQRIDGRKVKGQESVSPVLPADASVENSAFSIIERKLDGVRRIIVRNKETGEGFTVVPESGGRLAGLDLLFGEQLVSVLRRIDDVHSLHRDDIFTNAKLSPFGGRVRGGRYVFRGTPLTLPVNYADEGNACHGLVYDKPFTLFRTELHEDSAACSLLYAYEHDVEGYPFSFTVELTYRLAAQEGLRCTTRVANRSKGPMPLMDGWHHYVALGRPIDSMGLRLEVEDRVVVNGSKIPTGEYVPFGSFRDRKSIGGIQFDTCFRVQTRKPIAVTELSLNEEDLRLEVWQEAGMGKYNFLVVYTPPDRRSIAIEPLTSNIDAFNSGDGLIQLSPGEVWSADVGIRRSHQYERVPHR